MEDNGGVTKGEFKTGQVQFIFKGGPDQGLQKEAKKTIRSILSALEEFTNYEDIDELERRIVRSKVLDGVNNLRRVAMLYIETGRTD